MNKYNIKVGDYVETWDGRVGYVRQVWNDTIEWVENKGVLHLTPMNDASINKDNFIRIGANDFTKKKTKFEPIRKYNNNDAITYADKINELITHINAIQERLNEYDSERIN